MARGVNEQIIVGNFGSDPDSPRYTPSGSPVLNRQTETGKLIVGSSVSISILIKSAVVPKGLLSDRLEFTRLSTITT